MAKKKQQQEPMTLGRLCKKYKIDIECAGEVINKGINFNPEQEYNPEYKHIIKNFLQTCDLIYWDFTDAFEQCEEDEMPIMDQIIAEAYNEELTKYNNQIIDPRLLSDGLRILDETFNGQFEITTPVKKIMVMAALKDLKKSNKQRIAKAFDIL